MTARIAIAGVAFTLVSAGSAATAQPLALRGEGRVLVVPFDAAGHDSRLFWLGEASAVLLGEDLAARGVDVMTRDERRRAFDELQLPARAALSYASLIRVGELVGAADIVFGSLALDGDRLTVTARSVRLDAGRLRPDVVDHGPLSDLFATFDRIADRQAGQALPSEAHAAPVRAPLSAFENYIKGLVGATPTTQIKFLSAALKAWPSYDAVRFALWQVHTAQDEHAKALAAVMAVPDRSPEARRARFLAALSRLALKQYDEALATLGALSAEQPAAAIFNNMGLALLRRGGTPSRGRASSYFNQAVAADPWEPDYAFNLGYALWIELNTQDAVRWLREAVRLNPADADAHFVLGVALGASRSGVEGDRELELARRLSSRYAELAKRPAASADVVPGGLGRVQDDLDRGARSLIELTVAPGELQEQRELAEFHLDRGRRLYEAGQDREALVELRRSLYLAPYEAGPQLLVARIYVREGRATDAIAAAKIAIWCEDSAAAHVVLGDAYLLARDTTLAQTEAYRALTLDPSSPDAKNLLAKLSDKRIPDPPRHPGAL